MIFSFYPPQPPKPLPACDMPHTSPPSSAGPTNLSMDFPSSSSRAPYPPSSPACNSIVQLASILHGTHPLGRALSAEPRTSSLVVLLSAVPPESSTTSAESDLCSPLPVNLFSSARLVGALMSIAVSFSQVLSYTLSLYLSLSVNVCIT